MTQRGSLRRSQPRPPCLLPPPPRTTPSNSGPSQRGSLRHDNPVKEHAYCVWDFMVEDALVSRYDHHTEFAVGVDMSVLVEGLIASTGWDELAYVWQHGTDPRAS